MAKQCLEKPQSFYKVFERKGGPNLLNTHYCPGCGHGVLHKLIAEALDELGVTDRTILISPVGCSVFAYYYFECGNVQVAHGRAPAVATGIKRALPHSIVLSYQGDGDLAAIGGNNILQAANRGENITVFFVNNAIYGMTGSQMAPTTLIGQRTMTTPRGRDPENEGYPMKAAELLSGLEGVTYIERTALFTPKEIQKTRKAIRRALQCQIDGKGFSMVEVLSQCPTGWRMDPVKAVEWAEKEMATYFELGVKKDVLDERPGRKVELKDLSPEEIKQALGIAEKGEDEARIAAAKKREIKHRNPRIRVAGFGGQGILLLGELIAEGGMLEGLNVTWLPSYGPEMRGGTANCHVIIDEGRIGAPVVDNPDVLIAMNLPSLDRFECDVVEGGLILYDSSLIDREVERQDVESVGVPATKTADDLGSTRAANMVMLGAYIGATGIIAHETALDALEEATKRPELLEINKKAIQEGMDFVAQHAA